MGKKKSKMILVSEEEATNIMDCFLVHFVLDIWDNLDLFRECLDFLCWQVKEHLNDTSGNWESIENHYYHEVAIQLQNYNEHYETLQEATEALSEKGFFNDLINELLWRSYPDECDA